MKPQIELLPDFQDFYSRIADRVNSGSILRDLPSWIVRHTRLKGRPWSFKDHEFQLDIARDTSPRKVVKKCSQVGLTELQIRLALAYLYVSNGRSLMYVMPYTRMAMRITQSRIDPVIAESSMLSKSLGSDSSTYKRIGNSNLYIGGADKPTEAISSPIDRIIIDERDFCRDRVLGIYSSRMRHTEEGEGMRDEFSTPTISNYGITAEYEKSDKKRYLCKCLHCNHWQAPDFEEQVVIPGYDGQFRDLDKDDFIHHRYQFSESWIRCAQCGRELDSSLMVAEQREWVAELPHREVSGYAVKPFDLYRYNRTPRVVEQFADYPLIQDYYNFVLGEDYDASNTKINDEIVSRLFTGERWNRGSGLCVGIDVGKNVHVMVGKRAEGKLRVVNSFKLRFAEGDMFGQVCEILDRFEFTQCIIDAGPDISLPRMLVERYGDKVYPCVYVRGRRTQISIYEIKTDKDDFSTINATRNKLFDAMVEDVNNSKIEFMRCSQEEQFEIRTHFQQMARKTEEDDEGERHAKWVKLTENDHFFHSLAYLYLAAEVCETEVGASVSVAPFGVSGAVISSRIDTSTSVARAIRMFGYR